MLALNPKPLTVSNHSKPQIPNQHSGKRKSTCSIGQLGKLNELINTKCLIQCLTIQVFSILLPSEKENIKLISNVNTKKHHLSQFTQLHKAKFQLGPAPRSPRLLIYCLHLSLSIKIPS